MNFRVIIALWGVIGITYSLGKALYRMAPRVIEAFQNPFTTGQLIFLIGFTSFMLYFEGYKGFQKKYSPRTAARVKYLRDHPHWLRDLLAPLFVMGYFHANRKTKIKAYALTFIVAALVWGVKHCDQPWRGIVDLGVILGLGWGLTAFWIFSYQALTGKNFTHSPEMPEENGSGE